MYKNHGAKEPIFGVKVADLKKLRKETGIDLELSKQLFNTKNVDSQYFAALITEPKKLTKAEVQGWAELANWYLISEYSIAWATLSALFAIREARKPDIHVILSLLSRIEEGLSQAKNRVKYTMNGFVISVGTFYPELIYEAQSIAENIGKVDVYLGKTNCRVPCASEYLAKVVQSERWGKQRKTFRN